MSEEQKVHDENQGHSFDGVSELNNKPPLWIVLLFIATIAFSLLYAIYYFGYPGNGKDQASEYDSSVVQAKRNLAVTEKKNTSQQSGTSVAKQIEKGASLFNEKGCIACHGMNGEGNNIGPNLTDNTWINGCSQEAVEKIITEGNPMKGMTSFKSSMSPDEIKCVATFIHNKLVGSKPANAKAPQGVECK